MKKKELSKMLFSIENIFAYLVLVCLAVIPASEVIARKFFKTNIHSSALYVQHLVLWLTFVCGMITTREKKHLSLSVGVDLIKEPYNSWIKSGTSFIAISISFVLFICSLSFTFLSFDPKYKIGIFPIRWVMMIMPAAFLINTIHFFRTVPENRYYKLIISLAIMFGLFIGISPLINSLRFILNGLYPAGGGIADKFETIAFSLNEFSFSALSTLAMPFIIILIVSALLGTPIFILLGGLAIILFLRSGGSIEVIPNEAYTMLKGPFIPAIPLFTLVGFILSESKAGDRLVRLFSVFFGWLPGGMAIIAILVCAFFTTFTGASGVTILALGGLLLIMLMKKGYNKEFSTGLLTASGSIGLLYPPSLPLIMYGVIAQISIKEMFIGGLLPGTIMMSVLIIMAVRSASKSRIKRVPFNFKNVLSPLRESIGEILLPVIILVGYFKGITTLVETSAIAVIYVLVVEVFIHRDIKFKKLPEVFFKCIPIIGGVLMILAVAKGFSYYIVDAEVPMKLTEWSRIHIQSKYVFLILVNIVLLITGCFMDIFSAIIVVAPLLIPMGAVYGIHPVHLGIIFLANLQLGYLTPPVGINLFLASYRFEQPLVKIYKLVISFFLLLLVSVLLITYIPWITTFLLK